MLKPLDLIQGHYECRTLDETLPILTELFALQAVERVPRGRPTEVEAAYAV